ncbi:H-NS family nucleoid-associated regulatory protein [Paracoccus versutus]
MCPIVQVIVWRAGENAELAWRGSGNKPGWLAEVLAAGKPLEQFAI